MLLIRLRNATQMLSLIQSFSDGQDRQGEKVIKKKRIIAPIFLNIFVLMLTTTNYSLFTSLSL